MIISLKKNGKRSNPAADWKYIRRLVAIKYVYDSDVGILPLMSHFRQASSMCKTLFVLKLVQYSQSCRMGWSMFAGMTCIPSLTSHHTDIKSTRRSSGKMPLAVRDALVDVFEREAPMSRSDAQARLVQLEKEGRYQQETWG